MSGELLGVFESAALIGATASAPGNVLPMSPNETPSEAQFGQFVDVHATRGCRSGVASLLDPAYFTWKVVIECFKRLTEIGPAFQIESSQVLFGLGVDGKPRSSGVFVLLNQFADSVNLCTSVAARSFGNRLRNFPKPHPSAP